jgi:hypothetical protein
MISGRENNKSEGPKIRISLTYWKERWKAKVAIAQWTMGNEVERTGSGAQILQGPLGHYEDFYCAFSVMEIFISWHL